MGIGVLLVIFPKICSKAVFGIPAEMVELSWISNPSCSLLSVALSQSGHLKLC